MSDYLTEEEQKKLNSKLTGLYTHIRNVETDQQKLYQKRGLSFLPGRKKKSEEMRENEWQELEKRKKNYKDSIKRITGGKGGGNGKKATNPNH